MVEKLRSNITILVVIALCLLPQILSSGYTFMTISKFESESWLKLLSGMASIPLELAILIYVLRGKRNISLFFMGVSILMNFLYYWEGEELRRILMMCTVSISLPVAVAFFSHEIKENKQQEVELELWKRFSRELQKAKEELCMEFNQQSLNLTKEYNEFTNSVRIEDEFVKSKIMQLTEIANNEINQVMVNNFDRLVDSINEGFSTIASELSDQIPEEINKSIQEQKDKDFPYKCPTCNKGFETDRGLKVHIGKEHQQQTEIDL